MFPHSMIPAPPTSKRTLQTHQCCFFRFQCNELILLMI